MQRRFCFTDDRSLTNTYGNFRKWLDEVFCEGVPTDQEWIKLLEEDAEFDFSNITMHMTRSNQSNDLSEGDSYDPTSLF